MRSQRSEHKLETKIETFLSRKFKQFPELSESSDSIASLAQDSGKRF